MQGLLAKENEVKAIEVLSFPDVELQKNYDGKNKISGVGILSVLYFPDYNRFVLYLHNWSYALLKRIPIVASTRTLSDTRCYVFPSYTGHYILKLNKIPYVEALQNFETILKHNSQFSYEGEQQGFHHRETSPTDRFVEYEQHGDQYMERGGTQTGRLRGKEKIKKGFKKIASKLTSHYSSDQKNNLNLRQVMDYSQLKTSGLDASLTHPVGRRDVNRLNYLKHTKYF